MRKTLLAAVVLTALAPLTAHAACTREDAQKKAQEMSAAVQAAVQKNPQQAQALMTKMQAIGAKYQTATASDDVCKAYDELIAEAKK